MATKEHGRWQETFGDASRGHGLELVVTRKGIEVHGAYDSGFGGFEPIDIPWRELLNAKDRVRDGRAI